MKCPSCGYVSFQSTGECVKCGAPTPPAAPGGDSEADYRRGVRRNERNQLGFTFPDEASESAETLGPADETSATVADAKTRTQTKTQTAKTQTVTAETRAATGRHPRPDEFEGMAVEAGGDDDSSSYDSGTHWESESESATAANTWVEMYREAAHFGRRALALTIDGGVFLLLFAILAYALQGGGELDLLRTANVPAYLFLIVLNGFYFTFFHAATGQTPGKMLFGIRVVSTYGGVLLTPWDAFMRWMGYFLSAAPLGLGFLWAIIDQDDRALHDRFAKSVVVVVASANGAPEEDAAVS